MIVRNLRPDDIPKLQAIAQQNGFEYVDPESLDIEAFQVVEDETGVIAACAAKRITELYLWMDQRSPLEKSQALALLHESMATELRTKGYTESNAFLPPALVRSFGRRLMRMGWVPNWASFARRF